MGSGTICSEFGTDCRWPLVSPGFRLLHLAAEYAHPWDAVLPNSLDFQPGLEYPYQQSSAWLSSGLPAPWW